MTDNTITMLADIGSKPAATKRDALTIARRVLRIICQQRASYHAERGAMRRQARKLRQFLPFTEQQASTLDSQAQAHKAELLENTRLTLVAFGSWLLRDADGIADTLGFDQLADLLSINPVHREQARQEGGTSLQGLAYIAQMEDSATGHGDGWGGGGPLSEACHATMMDFIRTCPDHLLPDPFAPGAPFGPPLPPELRIV